MRHPLSPNLQPSVRTTIHAFNMATPKRVAIGQVKAIVPIGISQLTYIVAVPGREVSVSMKPGRNQTPKQTQRKESQTTDEFRGEQWAAGFSLRLCT